MRRRSYNRGEFVKSLSVENRSLFQKLWDEIKYLVKVATSGSKEAKELAKVRKLFEEAYRELGQKNTAVSGDKYALASKTQPGKLDPRTVTKKDVTDTLRRVSAGEYNDSSYVPIRISTPGIVQERLFTKDLPMAMPVSKIVQAMSEDQGPIKGKNVRGHGFTETELVSIIEKLDSPDYLYSQPSNNRGIAVVSHETSKGNTAVIVEFDCDINPAYLNGYEGGTYNIAISPFDVDGGMVGLFQYAKEHQWVEVFNKQKEGDPAKKFPATRPFAVEQDSLGDILPSEKSSVNEQFSLSKDGANPTPTSFDVTGSDFVNPEAADYGAMEDILSSGRVSNTEYKRRALPQAAPSILIPAVVCKFRNSPFCT